MTRKVLLGATALIGGVLIAGGSLATAASADVLYSSGPTYGQYNAYTIAYAGSPYGSQELSNSFTLTSTSTITGVEYGAWTDAGATTTNVDWSISTTPFDTLSTAGTTNSFDFNNYFGLDVNDVSFSTGSVTLGPGTYYLTLGNSITTDGGLAYWDENFGTSTGQFQNDLGTGPTAGGEAFTIYGTTGGTSGAPEPGTWALMMLGVGGIGLAFRQAKKKHGFSFASA